MISRVEKSHIPLVSCPQNPVGTARHLCRDLGQTWHGRGTWSVPLAKGLHKFMVAFADARAKDIENQKVDLWGDYPKPATTWRGFALVLEVSGPDMDRQPAPAEWLKR